MTVGSIPHLVKKFTRDARPGRSHPTAELQALISVLPPLPAFASLPRDSRKPGGGSRTAVPGSLDVDVPANAKCAHEMLTTAEHVPRRPRNAGTALRVRKCHRPTPTRDIWAGRDRSKPIKGSEGRKCGPATPTRTP